MKSTTENIRMKDLDDLPYVVTVPIRAHTDATKKAIMAGNVGMRVTVARVGEKLYPIGNMVVLAAYAENGNAEVPCFVNHVKTLAEAQMRHVHLSPSLAIDPFAASEAVEYVRARDENMVAGTEDKDYTKISRLKLAPGIREMMSKHIAALGKRADHIPSFYHMLRKVSKLDQDVQVEAVKKVLSYCDKMARTNGHYALPMPNTLDNMLVQFDTRTPRVSRYAVETQDGENGRDEAKNDRDSKKDKGKSDMRVKEADDMPGYYHNMDANNVEFSCECGMEYVVNKKNLTVRKREEQEKMILLEGDYGDLMYAIRRDVAEYLDLALQQSMYYYLMSKDPHGSTVIMSKNKITDGTLRKIMAVLKE